MRTRGCLKGALLSALMIASLMVPAISLLSVGSSSAAPDGLIPRAPIYIDGNDNFTAANGVTSGSGTESDPYIIEGWDISAENANGIEIRNTTAYFVIRNCYVHNGKNNGNSGIRFEKVTNGKVENVASENNWNGIILWDSDKNTITNCVVSNNDYGGILLHWHSNNNVISGCTTSNNDFGIYIYYSDSNVISGSNSTNDIYGIQLDSSDNNTVTDCDISDSKSYGIELWESSNSNITNCTISNDRFGIISRYSNYNIISSCIISNNSWNGIRLSESSNNNLIYHNNFVNNATQAYDDGSNLWDDDYPSGGNYWSDYTGDDNHRGENQDIPRNDGIGDMPYFILGDNNLDRYPLMEPWSPVIPATIEINPNTLNLKSRGRLITCLIELPEGYDVADIDIGSIRLNGVVPAEKWPPAIGDHDHDGISHLMVKFSRPAVQAIVGMGEVELTVTGLVNGVPFEGNDTIRVIEPGKVDLEARLMEIPFYWSMAPPAERLDIETEFMAIPFYWSQAPS